MDKRTQDALETQRGKRGKPFWAPVAGRPRPSDDTATMRYEQLRGFTDTKGQMRSPGDIGRRDARANRLLAKEAKRLGISFRDYLSRQGIYAGVEEGKESWRKKELPKPGVSREGVDEGTGAESADAGPSGGDAFDHLVWKKVAAQAQAGQWEHSTTAFTRTISNGSNMERQGAYLRAVGLLPGLTPQEHWDRRFGRLTARQRSIIRARERMWRWPETDLGRARAAAHRVGPRSSVTDTKRGAERGDVRRERARWRWIESHPLESFTNKGLFNRLAQYLGKYEPYASLPGEACTAMPAGATAPDGPLATTWLITGEAPEVRDLGKLVAAADELGLTDVEAAKRLGLTPPALSKAKKELRAKKGGYERVRQALRERDLG